MSFLTFILWFSVIFNLKLYLGKEDYHNSFMLG